VRIGLEMFGTQTDGRNRGVGRYVRNLAAALATLAPGRGHELVFYAEDGPPTDLIPHGPDAPLKRLRPAPSLRDAVARVVAENPDGLDALLLLNPLELTPGYDIPARAAPRGMKVASVVYDLIPLIFPADYLGLWPPGFARRYVRALERLRTYDRLLAISEATRSDLLRRLDVPAGRVVTIGGAGGDRSLAFTPGTLEDEPADRAAVARLGLGHDRPFVLSVGASDPRKNLGGLIEAFAMLPRPLRDGLVVAVAGSLGPVVESELNRRAAAVGLKLGASVVATGPVDDTTLRALYRRCAAFAFPSRYEGFGLPLLEAMGCGAVVVAGRNSSQVEVAGRAAILVNTAEPASIADGLVQALGNPQVARALRDAGPSRARQFTWDAVANRVLDTLESCRGKPRPQAAPVSSATRTRPTPPRPRVALVSPLPPHPSGVADYAGVLVGPLADRVALDLFHDAGSVPFARFLAARLAVGCHDGRLFDRLHRLRPYDVIVYQMGNSPAHLFVYELLTRHAGVVVLHDLMLASFHYERSTRLGLGPGAFLGELEHAHPGVASSFGDVNARWRDDPSGLVAALGQAGLDMNRRVVEQARAVIVHSRGAAERVARVGPGVPGKTFVVPHGAEAADRPVQPADRSSARARLGLPVDGLIVGQFGIVHPSKMNAEAIEAFTVVLEQQPQALLLIVGEEADGGRARRRAEALGLASRVRFWGRPDEDEFHALVAAADLGLCLRRAPTHGETSGALLHLLRAGVATIVSDVGSFAEFPQGVVRKVAWRPTAVGDQDDRDGLDALRRALVCLAQEPAARATLGRAAWEHVRARHSWARVAELYAEVIDWCRRRADEGGIYRGPHHNVPGAIRRRLDTDREAERGDR
jgi:glycosyltransferase involved in cell wall biosynthesis